MKHSFLGQDRNETAGNSFFVHNSEPDFSPQIFSMFFRSCVFPFSVLAFFFSVIQTYVGGLFIFTLIKHILGI